MVTQNAAVAASGTLDGAIPMTSGAFRRLTEEIGLLVATLRSGHGDHGDVDREAATVIPDGNRHLLRQRLDTLRAVLDTAYVAEADGSAVVGTRVTVRDQEGFADTYLLVAPGEADARTGRISPESPLGGALLGRRAGETVDVLAPAGPCRVVIEAVE